MSLSDSKEANKEQWWELYDSGTGKNYYHNAYTGKTVWKKPADADILPLAKLQVCTIVPTRVDKNAR